LASPSAFEVSVFTVVSAGEPATGVINTSSSAGVSSETPVADTAAHQSAKTIVGPVQLQLNVPVPPPAPRPLHGVPRLAGIRLYLCPPSCILRFALPHPPSASLFPYPTLFRSLASPSAFEVSVFTVVSAGEPATGVINTSSSAGVSSE